ncbi:MAG: hypothetical protein KKB31_03360 [Nanoarchaeota archaeon]|nr:hypothetical protein [Nanoarchaeota archaeon]
MKQVLLDTSFIMTCVRQKIDFFRDLELMGLEVVIPKQVVKELERKKAELALKVIKSYRFKSADLKQNYVDKGLMNYGKNHPGAIIATLDADLKKKILNTKIVIRGKKKLEIL